MRNSPMIEFPVEEFEWRLERLTKALKEANLDGIILTTKENTRYFSGLQSVIWSSKVSTPGLAIVTAAGGISMVGSASAVETIKFTGCVEDEDVYHFNRNGLPGIPFSYTDAVVDGIKRAGLDKGRVGMEFGDGFRLHLQIPWIEEIVKQLPEMEMSDASKLIWKCRSVKSAREIEKIRKIALINEECFETAFSRVKLNETTEMGLFRMFAEEAFKRHCEGVQPITMRFGKERFPYISCPPSDDVIIKNKPHDYIICDGSAFIEGNYYADMMCIGVVGELDEEQHALSDSAQQVLDYILENLHPGVVIDDLVRKTAAFAATTKAAKDYRSIDCIGHSVGLDIREFPVLAEGEKSVLEENMVFCVEPQFGNSEKGIFCSESVVAITESGCQLLSTPNRKPYIMK